MCLQPFKPLAQHTLEYSNCLRVNISDIFWPICECQDVSTLKEKSFLFLWLCSELYKVGRNPLLSSVPASHSLILSLPNCYTWGNPCHDVCQAMVKDRIHIFPLLLGEQASWNKLLQRTETPIASGFLAHDAAKQREEVRYHGYFIFLYQLCQLGCWYSSKSNWDVLCYVQAIYR